MARWRRMVREQALALRKMRLGQGIGGKRSIHDHDPRKIYALILKDLAQILLDIAQSAILRDRCEMRFEVHTMQPGAGRRTVIRPRPPAILALDIQRRKSMIERQGPVKR